MTDLLLLDDAVLAAAGTVSVPREAPADSFVLHAPLELAARVGLLPHLPPTARTGALDRIAELADRYDATGPAVAGSGPAPLDDDLATTVRSLEAALRAGDVDAVDARVRALAAQVDTAGARRSLAGAIVESLAAAGHAPIALHLLTRVADGALPATLLRGPLRELARHPEWRLRWHRPLVEAAGAGRSADGRGAIGTALATALAAVPHLGRPGSDFIFPLMDQAERSGAAEAALGPFLGADVRQVRRVLLRAAAWSMVHDDPDHAPYGWSHCLTLPQAVLSLAPDAVPAPVAIAVAGTHVVGFRAALGQELLGPLDDDAADDPAGTDVEDVVTCAAHHHDAHLAKYVLACLHAAEDDPAWRGTYLRAAAHLTTWWRAQS